mmetsp:Transcript_50979/g.95413  ORF Transcript_50979/g.95413 Transcript_50979/m.95413 type:complete len:329 (+) Transcript_50979:505-1491(+)
MRRATDATDELVGSVVHLLEALQPVWCRSQDGLTHFLGDDTVGHHRMTLAQEGVHHGDSLSCIEAAFNVHLRDLSGVVLLAILHHQITSIGHLVLPCSILRVDADGDVDFPIGLENPEPRSLLGQMSDILVEALLDSRLVFILVRPAIEFVCILYVVEDENWCTHHASGLNACCHSATCGDGLGTSAVGGQQGTFVGSHGHDVVLRRILPIHLERTDDSNGIFHCANVVLGVIPVNLCVVHRLLVSNIVPILLAHRHGLAPHLQLPGFTVRQAGWASEVAALENSRQHTSKQGLLTTQCGEGATAEHLWAKMFKFRACVGCWTCDKNA